MSGITLNTGLKAQLINLQSMQKLYDQTQGRLTTGYKVSSASDDVSAYTYSQALYGQADSLSGRIDGMTQAVSTISAADNGIESMLSVLSSMTALGESAMATDADDTGTRAAMGEKFNELLIQLSQLAQDSAYDGTNLLQGDQLTVQTGEDYGDSTIEVDGFYVAGLTQSDVDENGEVDNLSSDLVPSSWGAGASEVTNYAFALNLVGDPTSVIGLSSYGTGTRTAEANAALSSVSSITTAATAAVTAAEDYAETVDASSDPAATLAVIDTQISAALDAANVSVTEADGSTNYLFSTSDSGTAPFSDTDGDGLYEYEGVEYDGSTSTGNESVDAMLDTLNSLSSLRSDVAAATTAGDIDTTSLSDASSTLAGVTVLADLDIEEYESGADAWEVDWTDTENYSDIISDVMAQVELLKNTLQTRSSEFAFSESTITARQDYTSTLVSTLEDAGDGLVLADLNTESANLLALQTSQSLSVNVLSLSNEQTQSLLRILM